MNALMSFFATAPKGLEELLQQELLALGAEHAQQTRAGVSFKGSLQTALRACLWSRLANRILLPIHHFTAEDPNALYDALRTIAWHEHLSPKGSLAVDFISQNAVITHTQYGAQKVKDAVVDSLRDYSGFRPSVDLITPDVRINVHMRDTEVTLSIDLSGESLHKRGYRPRGAPAPLKENLAAALLLRAQWPHKAQEGQPLIDPMCGSGTLPIEAALMAADIAPGLFRDYHGFERWRGCPKDVWPELVQEAEDRRSAGLAKPLPAIYAYDFHPGATHATRLNATHAGVSHMIVCETADIAHLRPPQDVRPGIVVVNPPYGERLGDEESLKPLYGTLGDVLKERFPLWEAYVLTSNPALAASLALRAEKSYSFFNGAIACQWLKIPLFAAQPGVESKRHQPKTTPNAHMFRDRVVKNLKRIKPWATRNNITCYRIYDADIPEYAVACDVYNNRVHVQEYAPPKTIDPKKAQARLNDVVFSLCEVLNIPENDVFLKVRQRQKGLSQYEKFSDEQDFFMVQEYGAKFLVNLSDYLDTGLFLDHRPIRMWLRDNAKGKRFLNLFSYTSTATVHAALGGASSSLSVDLSNTYQEWSKRHFTMNLLSSEKHRLMRDDCLAFVQHCTDKFDLIFMDPPTFSNSKKMENTLDIQRDHVGLIKDVSHVLSPGGVLVFSTPFRHFKIDTEALSELHIENITPYTVPKDFERNPRIHSCFFITHKGDPVPRFGSKKDV
jgi:23S rRNA (guanine2445-N2)-methyltransferase / 23S rRNA (guanine2069-N7)-methyltransferase